MEALPASFGIEHMGEELERAFEIELAAPAMETPVGVQASRFGAGGDRLPQGFATGAGMADGEQRLLADVEQGRSEERCQLEVIGGVEQDVAEGQEVQDGAGRQLEEIRKPLARKIDIDTADLDAIPAFEAVADQILLDAKAPPGAALPGGNGTRFDWRLLAGRTPTRPWMLAGGLTPLNVAEAVRLTGARQVDVSSGVESAPGVKDEGLVRAFLAALA